MKDILELHNKHKNEKCFILGNGPSLNKVDFTKLEGIVTFGVNSIFLMTERNGFRPTYFVVEDNLVFKENLSQIDNYGGVTKILPAHYLSELSNKECCYSFTLDQGFYNKNDPERYATPYFNDTGTDTFYCGQSVTYINMQLAYFMGFREVYLLGMDFSYSLPAGHRQEGGHIKSGADDMNHFHKDYFGKGKTWKDPRLGRVLRSYHMAKYMFEADNRTILNATEGGQLELFDRVDLANVI